MEYIQRIKESVIQNWIQNKATHKNVLILSGARQTGKSTFINHLIAGKKYLLLHLEQHPSLIDQVDACQEFDQFHHWLKEKFDFDPATTLLVVDEAQHSQKLGSFIRFMKEEWQGATVILTGSIIGEIHKYTPHIPVGRETHEELWPFTFEEFLAALGQDSLLKMIRSYHVGDKILLFDHTRLLEQFNAYLQVGGLPEVVEHYKNDQDYVSVRKDIFKSYENDFTRYFPSEDINLFKRAFQAVAANIGSPSKDSQVVRVDGPGYKKVAGIYARLEKWKIIIKCEQVGMMPEMNRFYPKRYFYDTGVLADLRFKASPLVNIEEMATNHVRTPMGGLVENSLALSLRNQFEDSLFGIRLSDKSEIDFGVKYENRVYPIECKMNLKIKQSYLSPVINYLEKTKPNNQGFLFYTGMPDKIRNGQIIALPFYLSDQLRRLIGESKEEM